MQITDLTLKDLQYVLAIGRYSSFSQAAEAWSVSQPALSKQLKAIETILGVRLFERTKRQVLPTEAGKRFIEQAYRVIGEAEKLLDIAQQSQGVLSGPLNLGVIASSCPYLLPYFIGPLSQAYPQLKLIVKEGLTEHLVQELKQGQLDAIIAATTFEDDLLNHIPLFYEPFLLAVNKQYPIKASKNKVAISDIDTQKILLLEDGHCLKDQTVDICAIRDNKQSIGVKATSIETLLHMTAGGLGISVIPALAAPQNNRLSSELKIYEFQEHAIKGKKDKTQQNGRVMALYYRNSYPSKANMAALAKIIQQELPKQVETLQ